MAQMLGLERLGGGRGTHQPPPDLERPSPYLESIGRADAPEPPLIVEFVGLTPEEQRVAIMGFPGGRRFVLAGSH